MDVLADIPQFAKGHDVVRKVVCAANRWGDIIVCSSRHHDKLMNDHIRMLKHHSIIEGAGEQGFIDQFNKFMTRTEAAQLVKLNGQQLRDPEVGHKLYSENVY